MTTETTADGPIPDDKSTGSEASQDKKKDTFTDKKIWERLCYMLLFGVIGYFVFWVIILLAMVQFIVTLVSGDQSSDLLRFSRNLATYLKQIAAYLGYVSDQKPCPFSPFPSDGENSARPATPPTSTQD